MIILFTKLLREFGIALKDVFTSAAGEYDPARAIGYGVVLLSAITFLGLSTYDTIVNRKFDYSGFALGLAGVSAAIAAAAAGVTIKKSSENSPGTKVE